MTMYSYVLAKEKLTEGEKNRCLAIFFSKQDPTSEVDWQKASTTFGAASAESMRVSTRNLLKKIVDEGTNVASSAAAGASIDQQTPKKAKGGRKRKLVDEHADGDDAEVTTPVKPKRGRAAKNVKAKPKPEEVDEKVADEDDKDGGNVKVKDETVGASGDEQFNEEET